MSRLKTGPQLSQRWQAQVDDYVTAMAWSPERSCLAVASASGSVVLIDSQGNTLKTLPGHTMGTLCLAWSGDSQQLATGGQDGKAKLWDPETGALIATLAGGAAWVEHLAWGNGQLATAAGKHLKVWDSGGELLQTCEPHPNTISGLQWHVQRRQFVSCCYGLVRFQSPNSPATGTVYEYANSLIALRGSPDGNWLICGCQDASVHLWHTPSGADLEMSGYALKVRELSWDATSRFLATGGGESATVWDFSGKGPAGSRPKVLDLHLKPITSLAFAHRGYSLVIGDQSGVLSYWNIQKPKNPLAFATSEQAVSQVLWVSGDRFFVVGYSEGHVIAWNPPSEGRGFL